MAVKLRLRELAQERHLNLSQVQRRSGLTMTMVRRYWRNETSEVSLRAIEVLSELLQIAPGDLFTRGASEEAVSDLPVEQRHNEQQRKTQKRNT